MNTKLSFDTMSNFPILHNDLDDQIVSKMCIKLIRVKQSKITRLQPFKKNGKLVYKLSKAKFSPFVGNKRRQKTDISHLIMSYFL